MVEVCAECGSGGHVICCDFCPKVYHLECTQPVLRRVPRGEWKCHRCPRKRSNRGQEKHHDTTLDKSESGTFAIFQLTYNPSRDVERYIQSKNIYFFDKINK